jgi:hypothetical protein
LISQHPLSKASLDIEDIAIPGDLYICLRISKDLVVGNLGKNSNLCSNYTQFDYIYFSF